MTDERDGAGTPDDSAADGHPRTRRRRRRRARNAEVGGTGGESAAKPVSEPVPDGAGPVSEDKPGGSPGAGADNVPEAAEAGEAPAADGDRTEPAERVEREHAEAAEDAEDAEGAEGSGATADTATAPASASEESESEGASAAGTASEKQPAAGGEADEKAVSVQDAPTGEATSGASSRKSSGAKSAARGGSSAAPAPKSGAARGRSRGKLAAVVSVSGELLITAGVVLALFVVYSLWWTNVLANREADRESDRVRDNWAADRDVGANTPTGPGKLDTRDGIGFLHAPGLGKKEILIKPGTDPKELNQGIAGYYKKPVKSAMPWDESGNFSLAAHRDGHGAKFHNIHKLKDGDPLVFETKDTWYVYEVYSSLPETSKYNTEVLDAIPKESGATEKSRYITLTTCTPVYTSNYRYIVWGELVRTEKVDADRTPPAELG